MRLGRGKLVYAVGIGHQTGPIAAAESGAHDVRQRWHRGKPIRLHQQPARKPPLPPPYYVTSNPCLDRLHRVSFTRISLLMREVAELGTQPNAACHDFAKHIATSPTPLSCVTAPALPSTRLFDYAT